MVFPVSIGDGLRVFPAARRKAVWRPVETRPFPSGARLDVYHRA